MKKKTKAMGKVKLIIVIGVILVGLWFAIGYPYMTLKSNEKKVEHAARRYFEINSAELPTGNRIKTVSLKELYHKAYLKEDVPIPYTSKVCSPENSWVKVRKEDGEYKYYTYLECGILSSNIDHKGPVIHLNGDQEITIGKNDDYQDAGVKSVTDNADGKMDIKSVEIINNVKTNEIGTYEVTYIAYDSLRNRTEVKRTVKVVQMLYNTIAEQLGEAKNFKGGTKNNYVRLSNILFRVYGVDDDKNVILVADEDLGNVNYSQLDKWLDYFYGLLNETTQKMIVEKKYCNEALDDGVMNQTTCEKMTKERKVYIPSVADVNNAENEDRNFMRTLTLSWLANPSTNDGQAYTQRSYALGEDVSKDFFSRNVDEIYGVRPMMTIKGDEMISGGEGTSNDPYTFGDVPQGRIGDKLNTRYTGEYLKIKEELYRIIKVEKDGTIKVIAESTVGNLSDNVKFASNPGDSTISYNPKDKDSVAYMINNKVSSYIDVSYFVKHEIEVPVYKNKMIYGKEIKTNKYTVKLSAPDMFEIFSAQPQRTGKATSYWTKNCSKADRIAGGITDIGVPLNQQIPGYGSLGVRVVAYIKSSITITGGNGTLESPYLIS